MNQATNKETAICATCGQPLHGPYCGHCGEKKLDKHDRRIIHIFEEFIHSITHADSKFLRSIKYLFTKPGFLTSEYLAGRRKRYSSPLSLFFIANLLYILIPLVDTFNSQFKVIINGQPYSEALIPEVRNKLEKKQWTMKQLEERYDEKSAHEAKLLLILYVFLLSIPTAVLFISRRLYYYDYFVFAMEYFNFIMYGLMILLPWLVTLAAITVQLMQYSDAINIDPNAPVVSATVLLLLWTYLSLAAHRVFQQQWWLTIIKSAMLVICTVILMFLYRYIAFEVTMFLL